MALNFSDQLIYQRAPYVETLYHVTDSVKLTAGIARKTVHWSSSQDIDRVGDPDYSVDQTAWRATVGAIFQLQL
jgi:hypothetical protein